MWSKTSAFDRRCAGTSASDAFYMWPADVSWRTCDVRLRRLWHARPAPVAAALHSVWSRRTAASTDEYAATDYASVADVIKHHSWPVFHVRRHSCWHAASTFATNCWKLYDAYLPSYRQVRGKIFTHLSSNGNWLHVALRWITLAIIDVKAWEPTDNNLRQFIFGAKITKHNIAINVFLKLLTNIVLNMSCYVNPCLPLAVLGIVILSVCPSVCLSYACFVTKRKNIPPIFWYHMKG